MNRNINQQSIGQPLTEEAFLALGMNSIAYMKCATIQGKDVWTVHAADGTPISLFERKDENLAKATLLQNDLIPMRVH